MSESEFNQLREESWRRPLTAIEEAQIQAFLIAHPELQAAWEEELALSHALAPLPEVALSSNFTSQVMQALDAAPLAPRSNSRRKWFTLPRLAWATGVAALILGGFGIHRNHMQHRLERQMSDIFTAMPAEPEVFVNFNTIHNLNSMPSMDEDLWVALNQL